MSVMALREVVAALLTQCYDDLIKPPLKVLLRCFMKIFTEYYTTVLGTIHSFQHFHKRIQRVLFLHTPSPLPKSVL